MYSTTRSGNGMPVLNPRLTQVLVSIALVSVWIGLPARAQNAEPSQKVRLSRRQPLVPPEPAQRDARVLAKGAVHANATSCNLSYYGGPVVSNVEVAVVYWNFGVDATAQANLPGFYQGLTESSYLDMLSEYSTDVAPVGGLGGTNQSIGRGSYLGTFTIVPTTCNDPTAKSCNLADSDLQAELEVQIGNGNLPAPDYDAAGNVRTVYMFYFPPNITLTTPSGTSCQDFCGYHSTFQSNSQPVAYGALMDTTTGPCAGSCGNQPSGFNDLTYISSHELAEAITDTAIGLDTSGTLAPPLAWYANGNTCGEIGDICFTGSPTAFAIGSS